MNTQTPIGRIEPLAPTIADRLGEFLVALAGTDRPLLLTKTFDFKLHAPPSTAGQFGGLVDLVMMGAFLRHHELAATGDDAFAFGAARLALEVRLEAILEEMHRKVETVQ